ncbi:unnamed protein product [Effrenium voratum]|nr:unnamed protein product [Effrenium voratum]
MPPAPAVPLVPPAPEPLARLLGLAEQVDADTEVPLGELDCAHCESLLHQPATLEDGLTVCLPCVKKRRMSGFIGEMSSFGHAQNVILSDLAAELRPDLAAAVAARQKGNACFAEGHWAKAEQAYSEAIASSPDLVLFCNRAIARLKLEDGAGALADSLQAVALARGPKRPMRDKAWLRLGQCLGSKEAAFAMAMAGATPQLQDVAAQLSEEELAKVEVWLKEGRCPGIEAQLPAKAPRPSLSFGQEEWLRSQLECPLCLGLLWEPASIPCGHTLCRCCLARTLDHAFDTAPSCPMCRKDLAPYLAWLNARARAQRVHGGAQIPVDKKIAAIIERCFSEKERLEREAQVRTAEAEADGRDFSVPIFICSMAMPSVACPLHIFEPRYRLMMRRCIDSGQRQFGMCLFPGAQYGTMLHIESFNQLPDGRSQIKTLGTRRFEVLEWGEKDGYATGKVRWLEDVAGEPGPEAAAETPSPHPSAARLRNAVQSLLQKLPEEVMPSLEQQLGPMPPADGKDGFCCPNFIFWCMGLASLPPRLCYELCFGDAFRQDAEKRLTTILEVFAARKVTWGWQGPFPPDVGVSCNTS